MFNKILIIDDNIAFTNALVASLKSNLDVSIDTVDDYTDIDLDTILKYDLYIIHLTDITKESISYLSNLDKLIIVLAEQDTQETRKEILSLNVTDYVIINTTSSHKIVSLIVKRLANNANKTILIVDDSKLSLMQISMILEMQNLNYIECANGQEAWEYLQKTNSEKIDLVVTDYEMPFMNGYELVQNIRTQYHLEELPVLVISATEDSFMIPKFLKAGANDYINKPFIYEEFIARITNALSLVDMFKKIKNMAMTDYLTGINNRVYFYEAGANTLEISRRAQQPVAIAMLDIDNFKKINDTYGHEVGDKALIHITNVVKQALRRSDIFVRFGGEEFVILLPNCSHEQAVLVMQKVCKLVAKSTLYIDEGIKLNITISIGVTSQIDTIDNMVELADKYMYHAKNNGKNQVYSQD